MDILLNDVVDDQLQFSWQRRLVHLSARHPDGWLSALGVGRCSVVDRSLDSESLTKPEEEKDEQWKYNDSESLTKPEEEKDEGENIMTLNHSQNLKKRNMNVKI